ncbi:AvrD family protein [Streptomyces sp. WI04-05B]|uniref:AvrD family protein n=1 Tax=Streptomyces TaxID=1883 RepID=UPI0029A5E3D7|nr:MULTISPECIES: AvrD family protein [unclassified Streptomyces]MDX2542452.1 AvrD family protein [Streptomyces sp. WI04-05B]MDX2582529.1 AvrD family protein [Streptomyces sp. WI04-05A]MDX3747941.1 AvrD family protein [Streptomyces sp. AK08-02]
MQVNERIRELRLRSVDEVLGDRHARFFGEGFKRVTYSLTDIAIAAGTPSTPGEVRATAGIHLPDNWSLKGEAVQRPHLSTLDGMLLAARLTGLYAAHTHRLAADAPFRVLGIRIKAGAAPDEEGLERFDVTARHRSTTASPDTAGLCVTTMECTVASMTLQIEAEHPAADEPDRASGSYGTAEDLDGPWNSTAFGVSHHSRAQYLEDVVADVSAGTAHARLTLVDTPDPSSPSSPSGPDAAEEYGPTAIDLFVSALQLGQVLLYELDGLTRADSNTLWMRSTVFAPSTGTEAAAGADPGGRFRVTLDRTAQLPTAEGTWRTARITASLGGTRLTCNVVHLLP